MADNKNNESPSKDNIDMNVLINQLFNEIMSGQSDILLPGSMAYNVKIKIEGNAISVSGQPNNLPSSQAVHDREPLIDLIDKSGEVILIAELPGAEKGSITLMSDSRHIEITAKAKAGEYKKKVAFGSLVNPKKAVASYKNGVLEVSVKKSDRYKGGSVKIDVV